jgi:hypothetical protein
VDIRLGEKADEEADWEDVIDIEEEELLWLFKLSQLALAMQ